LLLELPMHSFCSMENLLTVEGLHKRFGKVHAVAGLDFSIPPGICFGLLGPNGAGKTTSIEIMEGILAPDEGKVLFKGKPIDRYFKQKVGIQFQHTALPEFITVKETLELFRAFYPDPRPMDELIELCSLSDILGRDNQKLSGGQKQRMLLALAIIPRPELVFLDEPTTGLDPQARRNFWELIRRVKAEGATVILTTHYMDEAQVLCDDIAIMDQGKILERGSPQSLLDKHFGGVILRLPCKPDSELERESRGGDLSRFNNSCTDLQPWREIQTDKPQEALRDLLAAGEDLAGLSIHRPNLEDLFIKLTGSQLRV